MEDNVDFAEAGHEDGGDSVSSHASSCVQDDREERESHQFGSTSRLDLSRGFVLAPLRIRGLLGWARSRRVDDGVRVLSDRLRCEARGHQRVALLHLEFLYLRLCSL